MGTSTPVSPSAPASHRCRWASASSTERDRRTPRGAGGRVPNACESTEAAHGVVRARRAGSSGGGVITRAGVGGAAGPGARRHQRVAPLRLAAARPPCAGRVTLWIDARLSPALADWITERLGVVAIPVKTLGLRGASDAEIIRAGRRAQAVVMTKGVAFVRLLEQHGPPKQVLWLTVGNTSNARMKEVLAETLQLALDLLRGGKPLVEVRDRPSRSLSG